MTVTMYTTNITISVMYRVGFLKKSMLEKTKFQSMVLGTTTQPPANVVMWVHLQWMPLLFVNGPTLVSTFILVFKNYCYYKQGEIQCISWNIEYQAVKSKMWCWWKTFIVKTQINFYFSYISFIHDLKKYTCRFWTADKISRYSSNIFLIHTHSIYFQQLYGDW